MSKETEKQPRSSRADHLKKHQWKKGQSGNPKGREPKELCLTSIVKAELEKQAIGRERELLFNKDGSPRTWAQVLGTSIVRQAASGKAEALKQLWERIDGKVPLPLEHTGKGGGPIAVKDVSALRGILQDPKLRDAALEIAQRLTDGITEEGREPDDPEPGIS